MQDLNNVLSIVKNTEPTIFNDDNLAIIRDLIKYQDYYENKSFNYIVSIYPEYGQSGRGKDYKPTQVPFNYAKFIVDKLAAWQFEESIDFNCTSVSTDTDDSNTVDRSDEIEKDLYDIHKQNKMDIKLLQSATESNISGGIAFKLKYDDVKKYPRILIRNRIETFVVTEFDDYENIIRVHFIAFQDDKTIWKQTYELIVSETTGKEVCYISEALYDTKDIKTPSKVIIERQPLGLNGKWLEFLPIYIVSNLAQLGEVWGPSELRDLIPIIDEINKKYSDLSDSLKFNMFAITVFINAKIPKGADGKPLLKNRANAAWEIMGLSPTDNVRPEVFKLTSTFNYIEPLKYHIESLISAIFKFSECIDISPQTITGVPSLSGVALKLLFAAILSKTNRKNTVWKAKLAEIYMGALKLKQIYEDYDIPEDLNIEIITHIPMPANELEEMNVITQKIADGLISITSAMNELGIQNPEEEIAKILEEKSAYDKALNLNYINNNPDNTNQDNKNNEGESK